MKKNQKEMPFWDHLEELRWRIIKVFAAVIVGGIITYYFSDFLLKLLVAPTKDLGIDLNLQVLKVTSMFIVKLSVSIMGGIIFGLPIIIYQSWRFISPAFEDTSELSILFTILFATIFFLIGLMFGYFIIVPFSLNFFTSLTSSTVSVNYNFTLDGYLTYVLWLLFACGLVFQLPVVALFFTRIGLLTPPFLRHYRKFAFISFLVLGALLTPPDPLSQVLIVIPLLVLYEFSIFISWVFRKKYDQEVNKT